MTVPLIQFIAGVKYAQLQLCMVGMVAAMRVVCCSFAAFSASVHLDVGAQGGGDAGV